MSTRQYNYIFSKLFKDNRDVVGAIAYSLYKAEKIEWIRDFIKEKHREPDENDLAGFHSTCGIESRIQTYRDTARILFYEATRNVSSRKSPSFWYGVMQSFVGSVIFASLILLLFLMFNVMMSKDTGNVQITIGSQGIENVEIIKHQEE